MADADEPRSLPGPDVALEAPPSGLAPRPRSALGIGILLLGLLGLVFAAIAVAGGHGLQDVEDVLTRLPAGLAISVGVHVPQIVFTALAWRCLLPPECRPTVPAMTLLRWLRESANTLLPAGAIVGQVAVARLLARWGVPGTLAAATATVDVTVESVSQALFTLAGLGALLFGRTAADLAGVAVAGALLGVAGIAALVLLQSAAALNWIEAQALRWLPRLKPDAFRKFRRTMLDVQGSRGALARAFACHSTAWLLGCVEVYGVLVLLGQAVDWRAAFVIESLGQAMRIAGFMLPGSFAVQEGAILAAAALVGIGAAPALTVALVRRTRELVIALVGVLVWPGVERAAAQRATFSADQDP